jgi:hypothetical protein
MRGNMSEHTSSFPSLPKEPPIIVTQEKSGKRKEAGRDGKQTTSRRAERERERENIAGKTDEEGKKKKLCSHTERRKRERERDPRSEEMRLTV